MVLYFITFIGYDVCVEPKRLFNAKKKKKKLKNLDTFP